MKPMIHFDSELLKDAAHRLFVAGGSPREEARLIADSLVGANLAGHDSHGVIRVTQYLQKMREGVVLPGRAGRVVLDNGPVAVLSGEQGYGQPVAANAMKLAMERAGKHNLAAVGVRDLYHVGRLGDYCHMAAEAGMIALLFTNTGGFSQSVAAFGAAEARMSTNPMAVGYPSDRGHPVVMDFATSAMARGKARVALDEEKSLPPGMIMDKAGKPSTDPHDLFDGGALLPLGGEQGYKGYLLNFMMEMLGGILIEGGHQGKEQNPAFSNSTLMIVLNVEAFRPLSGFKAEMEAMIAHLKGGRMMEGGEVLYPGEKEARTQAQRLQGGIPLPARTVQGLQAELDRYQVEMRLTDLGK